MDAILVPILQFLDEEAKDAVCVGLEILHNTEAEEKDSSEAESEE